MSVEVSVGVRFVSVPPRPPPRNLVSLSLVSPFALSFVSPDSRLHSYLFLLPRVFLSSSLSVFLGVYFCLDSLFSSCFNHSHMQGCVKYRKRSVGETPRRLTSSDTLIDFLSFFPDYSLPRLELFPSSLSLTFSFSFSFLSFTVLFVLPFSPFFSTSLSSRHAAFIFLLIFSFLVLFFIFDSP